MFLVFGSVVVSTNPYIHCSLRCCMTFPNVVWQCRVPFSVCRLVAPNIAECCGLLLLKSPSII